VYVFAPLDVSVIVFGEPLKACEHNDELLRANVSEGGVTTETCAIAELVQPWAEVAFTR
jgi:diphthamide biosynthesis methyltransferase